MARRVLPFLVLGALSLASCSTYERPRRPAWRAQAEAACVAQKLVHVSSYIQPARAMDGPGICGLTQPFKVTALQDGAVILNGTYTLDCPMIAALDRWLAETVQPLAQQRFGQSVVELDSMGAYSCRGMNGQYGAPISEHAFGNAIDIGGFRLADGRQITIVRDWTRGDEQTQAFLREVQAGACEQFTTVLAPGSNVFHYNHIHVDLAMHGTSSRGVRRICKPVPHVQTVPLPPRDDLPDPPDLEDEDQEVAAHGAQSTGAFHPGPGAVALASPPPAPPALALHAAASGPYTPVPPARPAHGTMRDDGAFEPDEGDATSSIRGRR